MSKCKEKGCNGEISADEWIDLPIGCGPARRTAYPCKKCGRYHWGDDGKGVSNRNGNKAFLKDGQLVLSP